jgi:hypothetical protein
MLTLLNRLPKYFVVILGCLAISFSYAQEFRADDTSILDIDGSGEVDALTDGLLLLRSMFGISDDVLINGVVSPNASVTESAAIDSYISAIRGTTFGELTSGGGSQGATGTGLNNKGTWVSSTYSSGDYVFYSTSASDTTSTMWILKGDTDYVSNVEPYDDLTNWIIFQAPKGDKGDTGAAGSDGATGAAGVAGPQGIAGAKGDTGSPGTAGVKGDTGSQGIAGAKGDTGSQGIAGVKGDAGADGAKGDTGDKGDKGDTGATGATGASGGAGSLKELSDALIEDNSIYIGSDPSNQTTTAENNVALGITALDSITTGDGNTAIGASADVGSGDLTNTTAIGNGATVNASNTIQLGNTSVTNVKTSGSLTAGAITIPNIDGSNGQLLATDGSGKLYWLTLVPLTEEQAIAITVNSAKTGITSSQASAITANTAKVGISDDQVEAINQISVNTEILSSYDSAITANTAKVGMTLGTTSSTALAGDTTTITGSQASAITANTAKTVLGLGTSSTTALAGNALSGTVNIGQTGTTTTVLGTLNVDEAVTLDTTLSVTGVSTFSGATALNGDVQIGNSASDKIGFFGATAVVPSIIVNAGTLNVRDPKVYRFDDVWHVEGESVIDMRDDVVSRLDMNRAKINELIQKLQELGLIN